MRRPTFALQEPLFSTEARAILRRLGIPVEMAAQKLGLSPRTLWRYMDADREKRLPGPVALALRYWDKYPNLIPRA